MFRYLYCNDGKNQHENFLLIWKQILLNISSIFILYENKMRVISKIICGIFVVFILFILVNLTLWAMQYWWTKKYAEYLNKKDRDESVSNVYLLQPKTWLSVFYDVDGLDIDMDEENENDSMIVNPDEDETQVKEVNHNPYDPDYEDEFNSFFGWNSDDTWSIISVQDIEDLSDAWFKIDDSTED